MKRALILGACFIGGMILGCFIPSEKARANTITLIVNTPPEIVRKVIVPTLIRTNAVMCYNLSNKPTGLFCLNNN